MKCLDCGQEMAAIAGGQFHCANCGCLVLPEGTPAPIVSITRNYAAGFRDGLEAAAKWHDGHERYLRGLGLCDAARTHEEHAAAIRQLKPKEE